MQNLFLRKKNLENLIELGNRILANKINWEDWAIQAQEQNRWFTPKSVASALEGIIYMLSPDKLKTWVENYPVSLESKNIGVVMAGNIPLVGFHDFICVLLAPHNIYIKPSSSDTFLIQKIVNILLQIDPSLKESIYFVERLNNTDAIIATGSDNSAKYFHYYFSSIPHIIRKNRISIGVLNGHESPETLQMLGVDILQYYGLGCRNISKLYVPDQYDWEEFFKSIETSSYVKESNKYFNNYEYQKAIFLMNNIKHLDNGFILLTESKEIASPIGVIHYEPYMSVNEIKEKIKIFKDKIQIVASDKAWLEGSVPFGKCQSPEPWDYADNVDTLSFSTKI